MPDMPDPTWWIRYLAARIDRRMMRMHLLRSYMDGNAPLPEGADGCRDAYKLFQHKARTNFAELVTDAVAERMVPQNFRVGDEPDDDDQARAFWKRNRLAIWAADTHRDMLALGYGYACVAKGPDGKAVATYESPMRAIVDVDPARPDVRRAGLLVYRDPVTGWDSAYLHLPGMVHVFMRRGSTPGANGAPVPLNFVEGEWTLDRSYPSGLESVPLVPFVNRGGLGEFETHTDLLDRINWGILQRLVIVAMQAYRQRATKGELPYQDEDGNTVDYGEMFKPGPGALWMLPEGVELWESAQTDVSGVIDSAREDLKQLAAVTRTPMSQLMPDNVNQSAAGAAYSREGLVTKTADRINRAAAGWSEIIRLALAIENGGEANVPTVDVDFLSPDRPSMSERYDALAKAGDAMPWRSKLTRILGIDGDEVDRMAAERAEDALASLLASPPAPVAPTPPTEGERPPMAQPGPVTGGQ